MSDSKPDLTLPSDLPEVLPVMALRRGVVLPGGMVPMAVHSGRARAALEVAHEGWLLVATQREPVDEPSPADLLSTAILVKVLRQKEPDDKGKIDVLVQGVGRASLTGFTQNRPCFKATFALLEDIWPDTAEGDAMDAALREEVEATAEVLGQGPAELLKKVESPSLLVDSVAGTIPDDDWKRDVLLTHDPVSRAEKVLARLVRLREKEAAKRSIKERLADDTREMRREVFLRQQLKAIQKELGEGAGDEHLDRLQERLAERDLPEEVQKVVDRELRRLERLGATSPERSVTLDWLEWIADLPWKVFRSAGLDLAALEEALDHSHHGLDDVKKQVVQHLAVRQLAGHGRADVLLLVGPPGVGKTSIGQAIADATGRKLVRVALGGVRDEAELRGHRRTYIGARPGRLVEGIRRAGTSDPVVLLDEVDKLSRGAMGNPAAALLEILDPEQNHHFVDHYLEVPLDLSRCLFVATANDLSTIPAPLRDRMETLRLDGYTRREKVAIASAHLIEKVATNAGLEPGDVILGEGVVEQIIAGWTREAGVRELQRMLGKLYRSAAVHKAKGGLTEPLAVQVADLSELLGKRRFFDEDEGIDSRVGLANGLAWTPVGGTVLHVEASTLPGRGQLLLTGQLGDVMKESARAALTYVLAHAEDLGIDASALSEHDVHIHVPAGAVPKDGPSAGVTMFTAMASLLSGREVRGDTAMTGEATLRGRVLPVGGIKAKVLAAHRRGLKRVILPRRNGVDLDEVPDEVREDLEVHLVDHMAEALSLALEPRTDEDLGVPLAQRTPALS